MEVHATPKQARSLPGARGTTTGNPSPSASATPVGVHGGSGSGGRSAVTGSQPSPTPVHPQQPPPRRQHAAPPSTVPSVQTTVPSIAPTPFHVPIAGSGASPHGGDHPPQRGPFATTPYSTTPSRLAGASHSPLTGGSASKAAEGLAPVMGHVYGSRSSPASVESTPYSYLSRITPVLPRDAARAGTDGRQASTAHAAPLATPSLSPLVAMEEETAVKVAMEAARQTYIEKLRGSIEGIMEALASELPQDHIFLQLMADPATEQYGKVRLAEIVEGFLYATQAQQYHNLAAELAQREVDNVALAARVAELERLLSEVTGMPAARFHEAAHAEHGTSHHMYTSTTSSVGTGTQGLPGSAPKAGGNGDADNGLNATPSHSQQDSNMNHNNSSNPMSEEEARRELMAILEATSRENELERCRRALAAPSRLTEVAQTEPNYPEKYEYVSDVVKELYRAVHSFMQYADGSLESLEALRNELALTQPKSRATDTQDAIHATAQRSRRSSIPERNRIQDLSEQLRDAQILTMRALDRLQQKHRDQARELDALSREVERAKAKDAAEASAASSEARALQREMQTLMQEHEAAMTAQRTDAQQRLDELQGRLRTVQQERSEAQHHAQDAKAQCEALRRELEALRGTEAQRRAESSTTAATLRNELALCRADLRACEGELLCAQVEAYMSTLEATYHESEAAKYALLQRSGVDGVAETLSTTARDVQEALRHANAQLRIAEAAALEKEVVMRAAMEELAALLRAMWEDESVAAALQLMEEPASPSQPGAKENKGRTDGNENGALAASDEAAMVRRVQDAHRLPTTLPGLTSALAYAYETLKGRSQRWQGVLEKARQGIAERDSRLRVLEATETKLKGLVQAEKDQVALLRAQLDSMTDASPMRELLARQDALLQAVSSERNALQRQWHTLSADYITLERRNGQLHERCAEKEHENAKLSGLLRLSGSASHVEQVSPPQPPAQGSRSPESRFGSIGGKFFRTNYESLLSDFRTPLPSHPDASLGSDTKAVREGNPRAAGWFPDSIGNSPTSGINEDVAPGRGQVGMSTLQQTPVTIDRSATRHDSPAAELYKDDFEHDDDDDNDSDDDGSAV